MKNKTTKTTAQSGASRMTNESEEVRGMRESIEEMERELAELDRDIAGAKKGDEGEMGCIALASLRAIRKNIVEMIASNKELYKTVLESEALERRLKGVEIEKEDE